MIKTLHYDQKNLIFSDGTHNGVFRDPPQGSSPDELAEIGVKRAAFVYKYANHYVVEMVEVTPDRYTEVPDPYACGETAYFVMSPEYAYHAVPLYDVNDAMVIRAAIKWIDTRDFTALSLLGEDSA